MLHSTHAHTQTCTHIHWRNHNTAREDIELKMDNSRGFSHTKYTNLIVFYRWKSNHWDKQLWICFPSLNNSFGEQSCRKQLTPVKKMYNKATTSESFVGS
jgi:hypothetical protein